MKQRTFLLQASPLMLFCGPEGAILPGCIADRRRMVNKPGTPAPLSTELARWAASVTFEDLPKDVVESTKLRVLDVIGLALAGAETDFGRSVRAAALAISPPGPSRILGFGDRVGVAAAFRPKQGLSRSRWNPN